MLILLMQAVQSLPSPSSDNGWRGVLPLHSTTSDVEKRLGPAAETLPGAALYRTKDGIVRISYSEGTPCDTKDSHWRVPAETVIRVDVTLSPGHLLSKFNLDETKYTKKSGGDRPEDVYYVNEEGEVLRVFNGEVMEIYYGPTSSDKNLKCPPLKQR